MTEGQQHNDSEPQKKEPLKLGGDNVPATDLETMNAQASPPAEPKDDDHESESGNAVVGTAKGGSSKKPENKSPYSGIHDSHLQAAITSSTIGTLIVQQGRGYEPREQELADKEAERQEARAEIADTGNALFKLTEPLGMEPYKLPEDVAQSVDHYLSVVRDKLLLIVSSPDPGTAYFAGRRLIDSFRIPDNERRRTLDFKLNSYESAAVDIDSLFVKSDKDINGETAVIIRCDGPQSARFLDSLFDKQEPDFYELRGKLRLRGVYLICLIPSQELTRRKISLRRELHFDVWHIDRFGSLLKGYYPDVYESLQERLFDQRKYGLWPEDKQEFYDQVKTALENGDLRQKLEANQLEIEKKSAGCFIPEDAPLKQVVYYVATFFPDLNPSDFNKVVHILLGDKTATITKTIHQQSEDETIKSITVEVEKPLHESWRASSDTILRDCNLRALRGESTVIAFSKEWMPGHFKKLFEENHSLYLDNQFEMIQSTGLLFSPSVKVAENVIALIVDRLLTFPDVYNRVWLFNLIRVVNATIEEIGALPWISDIVCFLHAQKQYRRISELVRRMLENPSLTKMANGLLEGLMSVGRHGSVFEIVKNLRYASNFDEFHWLKQLLEQGDGETAESVLRYLYGEMRRLNYRVYEVLHVMDGWLPDPNDTKKGYSVSGRSALELLVEYYEYSMREVTFENHGRWPTTYPLLLAKDLKTARDNLGLLIRWFFHPWMKSVLAERSGEEEPEIYYYTGSFVVGLSLLLLNSPDREWDNDQVQPSNIETTSALATEIDRSETKEKRLRPDDLFEILLQELVKAAAELNQRTVYSELAQCWKDYKTLFVHLINQAGYKQPDIRGRLIGAYKTVLYLEAEFNRLRVEAVTVSQRVGVC